MNTIQNDSPWLVGIARRKITPPFDVELAGLGYYLNRTAKRLRDDLTVTALVIEGKRGSCVAFASLDILYVNEKFVQTVRESVAAQTGIPTHAICINCSHSHNAPTASHVLGVGEVNSEYVRFVAEKSIEALVQAWNGRKPAKLRVGAAEVKNYTFNRTRENGPVDTHLSVLRADTLDERPLAVAFNFHSHLTAHMEIDLRAISRDWPGEVIDQIEAALPEAKAMFLQGTCGDVNLSPEFNHTERRFEPARAITKVALEAMEKSRPVSGQTIEAITKQVRLPTRRWTREEINGDREEGLYRLKTGDTKDWLNGFARVIVNCPQRLPLRYGGSVEKAVEAVSRFAVEWTDAILPTLDTRPEYIDTEIQAIRVGDVLFSAHSAELFSTLGLEIREKAPTKDLFLLGYSNGALGYLPDAYDVERKSYAASQSPKFCGRFPFTKESGKTLVNEIIQLLEQTRLRDR
jgi:neutral ceramidase